MDPTAQAAPMGGDQDEPQGAASAPSYVVEIACMPDGTFMVSVEKGDEEASEESGEDQGAAPAMNAMGGSDDGEQGEAQEPSGMPARTKKEALTMALDIINNNGAMPGGADDSFQAGFSGGQ